VGGGANTSTSAGIAMPGGTIPGAEVGGGVNTLRCTMWCHCCSQCGVWVSPSLSLRCVWCCGCCRHAAHGVAGAVVGWSVQHVWYCSRSQCSMCGVEVTVIAPHCHWVVSAVCECRHCHLCNMCGVEATGVVGTVIRQSVWCVVVTITGLCHMWCCSHGQCSACGVTGAVFVPCVVSQAPSLCHMWWCHGCCCCTMHGVVVIVIMPCVVYAAVRGTVMWCDDMACMTGRGMMTMRVWS